MVVKAKRGGAGGSKLSGRLSSLQHSSWVWESSVAMRGLLAMMNAVEKLDLVVPYVARMHRRPQTTRNSLARYVIRSARRERRLVDRDPPIVEEVRDGNKREPSPVRPGLAFFTNPYAVAIRQSLLTRRTLEEYNLQFMMYLLPA